MSKRRKVLLVCAVIGAAAAVAGVKVYQPRKSQSKVYPGLVSAQPSANFEVAVNGKTVFVQKYGPISFARFEMSGEAEIAVTASEPIGTYTLSPKSYGIAANVSDRTLTFTLKRPQRLVLRGVNTLGEELFLLADGPETNAPALGRPGVVDAASQRGIENTNSKNDSAPAINLAIERISAKGGGTLYFSPGVYNLRTAVNLRSNVNVYLAAGAVLQLDQSYPCCLQSQGLINFIDVTNAKLTGRGIVNGNAENIPKANSDFHLVVTENVENVEIGGVLLMDEGDACVRLVDARNSQVRDVKIVVNRPRSGGDGIDIDSSQHILIDNAFIYSSDDNTALHGGTGLRKTIKDDVDITVENSVFYNTQTGAAFKIGTEDPQEFIRNVIYRNIDVIKCKQGAAFYPTFGATVEQIVLQDIRVEDLSDRVLEFQAIVPTWDRTWTGRVGSIRNVALNNVSTENTGSRASSFAGSAPKQAVQDITFTNYRVAGSRVMEASAAPLELGPFVHNIRFQP